ncbi:MAG: hypothetical protein IJC25_03310 [Clostridia bacterium]|nr:hypothetical protein [Clostridia bacterium]
MSKLYFNEDCNHFVYTRDRTGIAVGREEIEAFVDQYRDTGVSDFVVCINASLVWAPSKAWETAMDKYRRLRNEGKPVNTEYGGAVGVRLLTDIYERQGLPMHRIWLERAAQNGMRPWISIRTNDIHDNQDDEAFLHSRFFVENHPFRRAEHRPNTDYFDNALDFMHPEVREHLFALIAETLDEYDICGLELDWMREITCARIGSEVDLLPVMTEFMDRVRAEAVKAEVRWGHPVRIAVRMPADPKLCMRYGFDVLEWVDRGLIDVLIVTPRWASTDNDMPIDLWKRLLEGKNVELAAGLEILVGPYNTAPDFIPRFQSPETARGTAAAYLAQGADAVYLFNFMDAVGTDAFSRPPVVDPKVYIHTLCDLADPDALLSKPRRHVVTFCDAEAPGTPVYQPLPLHCGKRTQGNPAFIGLPQYHSLRIPTGHVKADAEIRLVLGLDEHLEPSAGDLDIFVNAEPAVFAGEVRLEEPFFPGLRYWSWRIRPHADFPIVSIAEIAALKNDVTVHWAEIDVNPR